MADHNLFGKQAENKAVDYLKEKGYQILKRNYRFLKAEIDIIAKDVAKNEIVIVEVKARKFNPLVEPEEAVKKAKKTLLIKAADEFITTNQIDLDTRFDIVSIQRSDKEWNIKHIKYAFYPYE